MLLELREEGASTVSILHRVRSFRANTEPDAVTATANHKLIGMLAGSSGGVPRHLKPVHEALTASPGHSLFTWLTGTNATLLSQLAAAPGPVSHNTLDDLSPSRGARWLRRTRHTRRFAGARRTPSCLGAVAAHKASRGSRFKRTAPAHRLCDVVTSSPASFGRKPTSPGQSASIRDEVKSIVKLLQWLHGRGGGAERLHA